jgi:hypothetical protein
MDLGTVLRKITEEQYEHVEEFLDDTELIWDNCKSYNLKGSVKDGLYSGSISWQTSWRRTARRCSRTTSLASHFRTSVSRVRHRKRWWKPNSHSTSQPNC